MGRMMQRLIMISLGALALSACAGLTARPITSVDDEANATGFRYYENAPFLFVHTDGKGGPTAEIVMLPDTACPTWAT